MSNSFIGSIDGKTKMLGVIGSPIEHTLSPYIHNTIISDMNLPYVYTAHRVEASELENAIKGIKALGFAGINVTIPHKYGIMRYLDEIDPWAEIAGAVNTVKNDSGRLIGYNTDGFGFVDSLRRDNVEICGARVLMLGAGGAAKGISLALCEAGVGKIYIKNRSEETAALLVKNINTHYAEKADIYHGERDINILINTTPVGMHPDYELSPLESFEGLKSNITVCDVIYNPRETKLLREARMRGCKTVNGLGMLIFQAVRSFEIFTGTSVPKFTVDKLFAQLGLYKNIVLTGFMGAGKSTIGREIAKKMSAQFIDTDEYIERKVKMKIPDIFKNFGEEYFRELEHEAVCELAGRRGIILALGGGAVLNPKNIEILRKNGIIVRLAADFESIIKNLSKSDNRPLIKNKSKDEIKAIFNSREPFYKNCDFEVNSTDAVSEVANRILSEYFARNID